MNPNEKGQSLYDWFSQADTLLIIVIVVLIAALAIAYFFRKFSIENKQIEIDSLTTKLANKEETCDALNKQLVDIKHAYTQLDEQRDTLEKQRERAQTTTEMQAQQITHQQQQFAEAEQKCTALLEQNHCLEKEKLTLRLEVEQQQTFILELQQQFNESKQQLKTEFENMANRILAEKSTTFSTQNQRNIQQLLQPFKEQLEGFQKRVNEVHTDSVQKQAELKVHIEKVMNMGEGMREEAQHLASALKGNKKVLGNWGELQFELALERAGLEKNNHYLVQPHYKGVGGETLIPDFVVKLPEKHCIIVDSKVSLNAFQNAVNQGDAEVAQVELKHHIKHVRAHIDDLAQKNYSAVIGEESLGFVLMFMPIEAAYIEALKQDEHIFQYGYNKGVILVSQTTLMPVLKTISNVWMMANSNEYALEIGNKALDVYNQVVTVAEHLERLGNTLNAATNHYNKTIASFAGNQGLSNKVEKFKELSTKTAKIMPELSTLNQGLDTERLQKVLPKE